MKKCASVYSLDNKGQRRSLARFEQGRLHSVPWAVIVILIPAMFWYLCKHQELRSLSSWSLAPSCPLGPRQGRINKHHREDRWAVSCYLVCWAKAATEVGTWPFEGVLCGAWVWPLFWGTVWKKGMLGNMEELCKLWDGSQSVLGQSVPLRWFPNCPGGRKWSEYFLPVNFPSTLRQGATWFGWCISYILYMN